MGSSARAAWRWSTAAPTSCCAAASRSSVLREQYAADAEFVRRFYQEAESAAKLSHPNIVNTFDVGHQDDTYFSSIMASSSRRIFRLRRSLPPTDVFPNSVAIDYCYRKSPAGSLMPIARVSCTATSSRRTFW